MVVTVRSLGLNGIAGYAVRCGRLLFSPAACPRLF